MDKCWLHPIILHRTLGPHEVLGGRSRQDRQTRKIRKESAIEGLCKCPASSVFLLLRRSVIAHLLQRVVETIQHYGERTEAHSTVRMYNTSQYLVQS